MAKKKSDYNGLEEMPELRRYKVVKDPKKFARLYRLWKKHGSQEIYEQLLYGNSRLVYTVALKYVNRGLELRDLVQEGFFGLMRALEDFDPDRARISTYGTHWIRQSILKALGKKGRTIAIPSHVQGEINCVNRAIYEFLEKHKHRPTDQEVYALIRALDGTDKETGISRDMTLKDVVKCRFVIAMGIDHLDAPLRSDREDGETIGDVVSDTNVNIEASIDLGKLKTAMLEAIQNRLRKETGPPRILKFLRLRFELDQTLEKTGESFGLTRERMRQIEKGVLAKLAKDLKISVEGVIHMLRGMPLGAEKEKLILPQDALPEVITITDLFDILCQHILHTPTEKRIVKEPVRTLQTRKDLSPEEADIALTAMRDQKLIEGEAPWAIIIIIKDDVAIPKFKGYK